MNGGLGGGNGFMFRTRRQQDAEAFVQEFRGKQQRPDRPSRAAYAVVATAVLIVAVLGLIDWLG